MRPTAPHADIPIQLPDPSAIRAAIDEADERARLLRRLLRVATRLTTHYGPSPRRQTASGKAVACA